MKSMKKSKWTALQPRDGDVILTCGHTNWCHFFNVNPPAKIGTPDGRVIYAKWIITCQSCLDAVGGDPMKTVRTDGVWRGNAPVIKAHETTPEEKAKLNPWYPTCSYCDNQSEGTCDRCGTLVCRTHGTGTSWCLCESCRVRVVYGRNP